MGDCGAFWYHLKTGGNASVGGTCVQGYQHSEGSYGVSAEDEAVLTAGVNHYNLEMRAIYYIHFNLCAQMAQLQDEYVSFPQTAWQVTAVEIVPFQALETRYARDAVWGILDFAEQPGGGFVFVDSAAASILTGVNVEALATDDGFAFVEQWLMHLGHQFMVCWHEIAQFDVQMIPAQVPPTLTELQQMFPGLNPNTPVVTTAFRVSQPGQTETARVVLAIPQAYLLSAGASLQAIGETTLTGSDTTYFHERLDFIQDVPVPVTVCLGRVELTVSDLHGLEAGDVIELDTLVGGTLEVIVGQSRMAGKPGTTPDGRRLAVEIAQVSS